MKQLSICVTMTLSLIASACGSDSVTGPDGSSSSFTLMLKDAPFDDARAVLVTFSQVSAHMSGEGGFTPLTFTGGVARRTCDLKRLQSSTDVLAVGSLPAGHYTQVRLTIQSAVLYFDHPSDGPACAPAIAAPTGDHATVTVPSGEIKLNREFEVTGHGATSMLLDFDGAKSIHATGNGKFVLTPVIGVIDVG